MSSVTRVLAGVLLTGLFWLPGFPVAAGEVLDGIVKRGTIRVGTTGDYKPFTFRDPDGRYRGADVAMAERLAAALGVTVEIVPTVWGRLNQDFAERKFDVAMGGVTVQPAREALGPFTPATFIDGKRPIVRCADRDRLATVEAIDRPEVRLVVNPGGANEVFAHERLAHASLTIHRDNATVFDEIIAGRADVMVTDGIEVDHQARLHAELCAARVTAPFTSLAKAYWVQRDPELLARVDAWLVGEVSSGRWTSTLDAALAEP